MVVERTFAGRSTTQPGMNFCGGLMRLAHLLAPTSFRLPISKARAVVRRSRGKRYRVLPSQQHGHKRHLLHAADK